MATQRYQRPTILLLILVGMVILSCRLFSSAPQAVDPASPTPAHNQAVSPSTAPEPTDIPASPTAENTPDFCPFGNCIDSCMASIANVQLEFSNGEDYVDNNFHKEEGLTLAAYKIKGDKISQISSNKKVPAWLKPYRDDVKYHEKIWKLVSLMLPESVRPYMKELNIVTDGVDETLASTYQSEEDMDAWIMDVDILDTTDKAYFISTIVHEFSHLITLNPEQVLPSEAIFNDPENSEVYEKEAAACSTYFPDGCSYPDSYINLFYERFWANNDSYKQWLKINSMDYGDKYDKALAKFYKENRDQFVTEYAATNLDEDMAEAFTLFILEPKPTGGSIAQEKILFFYDFPELVKLRQQIAQSICEMQP